MKLTTKTLFLLKILVIIVFLSDIVISSRNRMKMKAQTSQDKSPSPPIPVGDEKKAYKVYFMYKYPHVQHDPNHKLNIFTFKNLLLSNEQMVFFESPNEGFPVK